MENEALSPELNQRLSMRFPRLTDAHKLINELVAEGFRPIRTRDIGCSDPAMFGYSFEQERFFESLYARVYWHQDQKGRIVWTKGFVDITTL